MASRSGLFGLHAIRARRGVVQTADLVHRSRRGAALALEEQKPRLRVLAQMRREPAAHMAAHVLAHIAFKRSLDLVLAQAALDDHLPLHVERSWRAHFRREEAHYVFRRPVYAFL